ncbi:hypothetical protein ASG43_04200 [Aureimonas sp. Leaf454]|uniref:CASTOR/POLLUX-related putative ion channel n=1 Tax=Aureimonas sp. Leaf454 TaxID=1736381 RepID=UPI0006F2CC83|nr:hypothetical protein [Aureimonas sp. Leaf454]KQT55000.1 hypothetical protein ASG43_04200 [Aureimonas sp. Leaf454]
MKQHVPWSERLRYEFDKSMAAGPIALIGWLSIASLVIIVVAGAFIALTSVAPQGAEPLDFVEASWETLMRTMDAGTMGGDTGWPFRVVMLVVTLSGIFIFSSLIGILSAGVNNKLEDLRKGRSRVLEHGHTVIFNWSPSIFDIVAELVVANANQKRSRIVIMAPRDKVEMEDEIAMKVPRLGTTRVICRSGDPTDLYDLAIVSPNASKSVIVLSPEGDDPDSSVVKTILALVNDPKRRADRYQIAAEIRDTRNADVARAVGGPEVQLVLADDLISRIVVQSSRQAGLSAVYSELLDFDGCEIYTVPQPDIVGLAFGDAILAYDTSSLIGVCEADGRVRLNPPMDLVVSAEMRAVIVAEDDDTIVVAAPGRDVFDPSALTLAKPQGLRAERTLILGWNRRGLVIARELSRYVEPGSLLTIAADTPELRDDLQRLNLASDRLHVEFCVVDTGDRPSLEALEIPSYDRVIVLGYSDHMAPQPADTRTLVTLLHLRRIADGAGRHISVVSEMTDVRNRELADVTRADDFVVSNKLVSLMLAQASENASLTAIFDELLDENGAEIYMRPVTDYVSIERPVTFFTIVEAARRRGEVAFGYRRRRENEPDRRAMGGVTVNPRKSTPLYFMPDDRIIVLAHQ